MIDAARSLAARLEGTPYATRLGLHAGELTADASTARIRFDDSLANAQGFVHGGVAASLSLWSAALVAVASDRDQAPVATPVSASVSYLAVARGEDLHATARLLSRGREVVHAEVEVASERGRAVAMALVVMATGQRRAAAPRREAAMASAASAGPGLVSPFARAMGIELSPYGEGPSTMRIPLGPNEGLDGAVDAGALLALADTCAALACMPSLDERLRGSATMSLSAVFGPPASGPAVARGRQVVDAGALRSAVVEVVRDGAAGGASAALTACVSYRFLAAA